MHKGPGDQGAEGRIGPVELTYSQGYKRLLSGQSIKSISSSCPLRDPRAVCRRKRSKRAVRSPILCEWWMWETEQKRLMFMELKSCCRLAGRRRVHKTNNTDLEKRKCFFPNALGAFMKAMQHQHFNLNSKTRTRASQISCDIYCTYPIR